MSKNYSNNYSDNEGSGKSMFDESDKSTSKNANNSSSKNSTSKNSTSKNSTSKDCHTDMDDSSDCY